MARYEVASGSWEFYFWPLGISTPRSFDMWGKGLWGWMRSHGLIRIRRVS